MKPKGYPKTPYIVYTKNPIIAQGQTVWVFTSGEVYITETLTRDNRFEIRINGKIDNFEEIKPYLTQIEDFGA